MDTVYIETSVIGYLTSRPNRDPIVAGHQEVTRTWWSQDRHRYRLLISPAVLEEISAGDPVAAAERQIVTIGIELASYTPEVEELADLYFTRLGLPLKAKVDALHLAYAVENGVDFLATWNLTHIANAHTVKKLLQLNRLLDRETPLIGTPGSADS